MEIFKHYQSQPPKDIGMYSKGRFTPEGQSPELNQCMVVVHISWSIVHAGVDLERKPSDS